MNRVLLPVVLALGLPGDALPQSPCDGIPDSARIHPIGRFSNLQYTEEHAYGYDLQLWRAGSCVLGLFEAAEGMAGDTPAGILSQVRYNSASGEFAFTTKLTTGVTSVPGSTDWVPTRDLYLFAGRLRSNKVSGKLEHSDRLMPERSQSVSEIVLSRTAEQAGFWSEAKTYGAWRKSAETILKFRGPKW